NTLKSLVSKEKEVNEKINDLITNSMTNYYFEQIGDEILTLRKEINGSCRHTKITECKMKMDELIKAYNVYSEKKITLTEILPDELKSFVENSE
ncbi:hypothetical protein JXJ21_19775, partial [candidate division KSB1 bacterium]|nr:hypothetical protein [candidate division KSB1 bacterium]